MPAPILLYDGVCGLCNRFVQFVLRHDRRGIFRFASLQSRVAEEILARHRLNAADLDTVYLVLHPGESNEALYSRVAAVIWILKQLHGPWPLLAYLFQLLPKRLADWGYGWVARNRYRIFGRSESCAIRAAAEDRSRFLDLP